MAESTGRDSTTRTLSEADFALCRLTDKPVRGRREVRQPGRADDPGENAPSGPVVREDPAGGRIFAGRSNNCARGAGALRYRTNPFPRFPPPAATCHLSPRPAGWARRPGTSATY